MSFQPVVIGPGITGWRFLERTYNSQFEAFNKSPQLDRDTEYFLENIGSVQSAEDLVKNRRLLSVALGAFDLQDDINNKYFIQKILEDGTQDDQSLANRLADARYEKLSKAFGFGPGELQLTTLDFKMEEIAEKHRVQSFEIAIGEQDDSMRIGLYAERELMDLATQDISDDAKWFTLMGLPPLQEMFQTALGLPKAFGQIDLDKQMETFRDRMTSLTGNSEVSQFSDPEAIDKIRTLYLARSQIDALGPSNSSSANALALLQSAVIPR